MNMQADAEILKAIPKTEIHLHLEGLASSETLWRLMQKRNIDIGIHSREDLSERLRIHNLNEFVDLFVNVIQKCIQTEEDIDYLLDDAKRYMQSNNVRYAEIFYSPTKLIRNGISYKDIVKRLTAGAERIETEIGSVIRYITDVSRSFGTKNAMNNLENHIKYRTEAFIGIGLGGSEKEHDAREFRKIFKKAAGQRCVLVAHAGEDSGPDAIWEVIRYLEVQRIGHGISAMEDQKLIAHLKQAQTVLEICPTSNLYTGTYARSLSTHPIRYFFDQGLNVTLNSDDPTPFSTSINNEYCKLLEAGLFTLPELIKILKNGIYGTFMPQKNQNALWNEVEQYLISQHREEVI